ncbi:carboxyphosphonoenolpyruvate phosphonomutase-like protein [Polychaeton citri CBS 116435]|uniref:Carboxyphosphonoenolpyruvate phosphonomutase-like protein n=1 Tax=Polychaeton citri CBS 116435 TaxID=1314669 RepID=A0A9P4QB44_9PEZI|nr:carboxyphosphonoenolpyruvate phosphonomutase-like protein [Polychaeton citri CBS 116435]
MTVSRQKQNELASKLRSLHKPGDPLILANCYDAATAKEATSCPSTKAIATASYGISAIQGLNDNDMTLEENFRLVGLIAPVAAQAELPLTVDLQDGFRDVGETIRRAIKSGAVGGNIEDLDNQAETGTLRTIIDAASRIQQAVTAAREAGVPNFCINARTDALACGRPIEEAVERGKAYLAAGALTVYVWGGSGGRGVSNAEVEQFVQAFDGMLNVKMIMRPGFCNSSDLAKMGVARVSIGPELYHKAMAAFRQGISIAYQEEPF